MIIVEPLCKIVGYAFQTVAGDEQNFAMQSKVGYTSSEKHGWTSFVDTHSIDSVWQRIRQVTDRVILKSSISENDIVGLVIASNFFETLFWENNDIDAIKELNENIVKLLKNTYKIRGAVICNSTACSSGASALVISCQLLADGVADKILVIGFDFETSIPKNGMSTIGAISKKHISPFSAERTGTDLADGIGAAMLSKCDKTYEESNKLEIYICGYGVYSDAYNITSPEPNGMALELAMNKAICMGGINKEEINYINAHGSGTKLNDALETKVIKNVFQNHSSKLLINSSKSLIGHTLGAAGLIEILITAMQMEQCEVHPTANYTTYDEQCDLNYCINSSSKVDIKYGLSNSIGFGGTNTSILLGKI